MNVALKSSNAANCFNVLPPGPMAVAIFIGSTEGNEWTGALPADGEYTIRVSPFPLSFKAAAWRARVHADVHAFDPWPGSA